MRYINYLYLIYTIKLKQLKPFLTKIMPTVPLTKVPLVRPKSLTKERGMLVYETLRGEEVTTARVTEGEVLKEIAKVVIGARKSKRQHLLSVS